MSQDLVVDLRPPYPVRIRGDFAEVWSALRADQGDRPWMIVADRNLLRRHPGALRGLRASEKRILVDLPGGERVKSLRSFERLHRFALESGLGRDALVVALGGGTIGDLAGFFASTWMRGVDWCPVATTSLSLADSAIGGKTAVDLGRVKNVVGSFHQPVGVYGALESLGSLPARHRRAGLAEVVKSGIIRDRGLFELLENEGPSLEDPASALWEEVLRRACRVKATIVAEDPREGGARALLNFGHTLGHALEGAHRPALLHGEAVSLGTIAACWISEELRRAPEGITSRVRDVLEALGLPTETGRVDRGKLWRFLRYDKKAKQGEARLVLTEGIGSATFGHPVGRKILQASLGAIAPTRTTSAPARAARAPRADS